MRPLLILALGAALAGAATVPPAVAAPHLCGQYEAITNKLTSQFGEKAVASGTSSNGRAVGLVVSARAASVLDPLPAR